VFILVIHHSREVTHMESSQSDPASIRVAVQQTEEGHNLPLPEYKTQDSAGLDLHAAIPLDRPLEIKQGSWMLVPTGLKIAIPRGYEGQVRPRSGLAARHGIGILNSPGTIDADYRGEVRVILFNFSDVPYTIQRGDRIAQIVICRVEQVPWVPVAELPDTERGEGGFGHTGR
jgi:dUTP pyrophosphatase